MSCRRMAACYWRPRWGLASGCSGGWRAVSVLQQHSLPGCRFIKRLSDLPRLALCETGTVKGDEAGPLGLTPLTCLVLPCVCLTRPFLIYSLPALMCTHTQLAAAGSCLPSEVQLTGQCCEAFSRLLLLCSLSPLLLALSSVAPHLACVHVCLHIVHSCLKPLIKNRASQVALVVKNPPASAGDVRDSSSIPWWGRCPGGGHGNPPQYSCQENPRDRGAWRATIRVVTKSQTRLKQL